jgi:phospholipase C
MREGQLVTSMSLNRREFLHGLAGLSGAAALLQDPHRSGIEHIVVVMMENRSFDHLLGWLPNSDGRQAGLWYPDGAGAYHPTHALAQDFVGCGHVDPDHSYIGGRIQYGRGAMDGFLREYDDDQYPIGYYTETARPFLNALARYYTTLDRSFCSILGPTFPNRFFLHGAQTDRVSNTTAIATMPTIWDQLEREGISHGYYYSNLPFLALWGLKYLPFSQSYTRFLFDALTGKLPAVSFVDPKFTLVDDGTGNDDHPHADIRSGDAFLSQAFHAVAAGPDWSSTVFIVTYDEWGGFFDHVPPPRADAPNSTDPDLVGGKARLGFRVPTIVASPWSRGWALNPRVHHGTFDHTSILKLIEWRWGLRPLTARDASPDVLNLASVLDLDNPRVPVPWLPRPVAPAPTACAEAAAAAAIAKPLAGALDNNWQALLDSGLLTSWPIYGDTLGR